MFIRDTESRLASEQARQELRISDGIEDLKQLIQTKFSDMESKMKEDNLSLEKKIDTIESQMKEDNRSLKEDNLSLEKKIKSIDEKNTRFTYFFLTFAFLVLSSLPSIKDGFNFLVNIIKLIP
jgi:high-affinity Fe2+/Pb2+ permease